VGTAAAVETAAVETAAAVVSFSMSLRFMYPTIKHRRERRVAAAGTPDVGAHVMPRFEGMTLT
jgi:hypothetical protein